MSRVVALRKGSLVKVGYPKVHAPLQGLFGGDDCKLACLRVVPPSLALDAASVRGLDSSHDSSVLSKRFLESFRDGLSDDAVEEVTEEVEPLGLLDFAITIGIEGLEELLDLFIVGTGHVSTVHGEFLDLTFVDFTVSVEVELVEGLLSAQERLLSSVGDLLHGCGLYGCGHLFLL